MLMHPETPKEVWLIEVICGLIKVFYWLEWTVCKTGKEWLCLGIVEYSENRWQRAWMARIGMETPKALPIHHSQCTIYMAKQPFFCSCNPGSAWERGGANIGLFGPWWNLCLLCCQLQPLRVLGSLVSLGHIIYGPSSACQIFIQLSNTHDIALFCPRNWFVLKYYFLYYTY